MIKKFFLSAAAVCAAFSITAAETAVPAAPAKAKTKTKAKAKPARKKFVIPADGGLKNATTPAPRHDPNAGRKLSWHRRYAAKARQIAKYKNKVDILFLGDSITHFWELSSKKNKKGLGGLAVFKKYFLRYNLVNLAYAGDRTENTLWITAESPYLNNIKPKMAVLMIGTNNIGHRRCTPAAAAAGIAKIVESLRQRLPETKIVLFAVFPRASHPRNAVRRQVNEINRIICKLADGKNIFYCDITDKFLTEKGYLTREIMPDLLHPGKAGYEIWAQAIMPYVEKFVGKK